MKSLRLLALVTACFAALLLASAGTGTRVGVWDYRAGLSMLRYATYLGIAASTLSLAALIALGLSRGRAASLGLPLVALLVGLVTAAVPYSFSRKARAVPPIHDITTDTADPPAFVAVLPLRAGAPNSAEYGGDSIATMQRQAYPDLVPATIAAPAGVAFTRALAAARDMGWEVVAADSVSGRIEATATTTWFGFKDDVVVRVRSAGPGTRVDVRSVSRVGRSDVGANAARIRLYLGKLRG